MASIRDATRGAMGSDGSVCAHSAALTHGATGILGNVASTHGAMDNASRAMDSGFDGALDSVASHDATDTMACALGNAALAHGATGTMACARNSAALAHGVSGMMVTGASARCRRPWRRRRRCTRR